MTRPAPWTRAFPNQVGKKHERKKRIRRISSIRRRQIEQYRKQRKWFLVANPWCQVALRRSNGESTNIFRSTEIHHMRGRRGPLLLDERFWIAVSSEGHDWIHHNPNEARKLGLLCQPGQWNKTPK